MADRSRWVDHKSSAVYGIAGLNGIVTHQGSKDPAPKPESIMETPSPAPTIPIMAPSCLTLNKLNDALLLR